MGLFCQCYCCIDVEFISKGSLKMKVAWAALTLASVLMPEAKQAPGPPLLRCDPNKQTENSTECIELCKEYGKNNKDGEKYCAHLVHCDGIWEDGGEAYVEGWCSDMKKCETDKDCEPYVTTSGSAGRKCTHDKICFYDGT